MPEFWDTHFQDKQMMWGEDPASSALFARDYFSKHGVKDVLIPGIGYGRNAKPFLDAGMSVTGIEISQTAIELAQDKMNLNIPIHYGSVSDMPFDNNKYQGIFSYAVIHLLGKGEREKFIEDCYAQLSPGGIMITTAISVESPSYGKGTEIGPDRYEQYPGAKVFFYTKETVREEFGKYGLTEIHETKDRGGKNSPTEIPFLSAVCVKK